ncbi:MAG: glycosyl hydrolase family 5 [Muricauda sp.]|nr:MULTISPECIES: glycoside hydrolase family 2 TIM barrel-domain containing protein [unclassified Allomuricauda]MAU16989.1 glycosyl hydrolase family 5 [Allomuricauda sp.]|tara:strand:- start:4672 stop:6204 length:1533 start_codon:yes stop_codon:yes gene_type:complete
MMVKKNTYRALLLLSFLAINAGIIYGLAAAWSFLNTGADKSTILHIGGAIEKAYQPKITWDLKEQRGRKISDQALGELEKDYVNAWYVKSIALNSYNHLGVEDYYTQDARSQIHALIKNNQDNAITIETTTLSHEPKLEFYSLDGKLAVLTDKNVSQFEKIYASGELLHQQKTISSYKVILLLEDGFWRIRQMVKLPTTTIHEKQAEEITFNAKSWKGINYYPKDHPWDMFGNHFDASPISDDFETIHNMGLNTVRVFVPYETFGKANVKDEYLQQLSKLLDIAAEHELKVLVTLFDFYGNYDILDWTLTHRHAETIVSHLKTHKALLGWDIKNEPDLDFESRGKNNVLNWLSEMAAQIKKIDGLHPVTIGWATPEAAVNLVKTVDFVSFHYYEAPEHLMDRFLVLKDAVGHKPLVLGEYGKSSYSCVWNLFTNSENSQAAYYNKMQKVLSKEQLPYFMWTLHDFGTVPTQVVGRKPWRRAPQKHYGLIDSDGNRKPAYGEVTTKRKGDN